MDSDQGKLFIGGISWETTEEKMKEYFSNYGEVLQTVIMRDKATGRPRGFGFVVFADPSILDRVLQDKHTIDGRTVEAKRAFSREEQQASRSGNPNVGRSGGGPVSGGNFRTKKIFVGGLPPTLTEETFCQYFQGYGEVEDVVVMYDQNTHRPRGFGFVSFKSEDAVDRVLHKTFHELNGKLVEVKRALPKDANPSNASGRPIAGGPYQTNSASGVNMSSYDGRADAGRYMQPPAAGGGYPSYGSAGYGTPGYGYGAANNGVGYGGYGVGGYGSPTAGYGGPAGAYGNPNAPAAGYASGPPGAPRSPWSNQAPSAYGSAGYGANAGYGAPATWNAAGSGGAAPPTGQSPSGTTGYGNQGYGYGGYGGTEGSYGSHGGYGPVGGRGSGGPTNNPAVGPGEQGAGPGYMGGGYGDASGGSGYPNSWRTDPSQGVGYGSSQVNGATGYGGAYGGAQSRQAQQQ
ncbi:heterogeneous nuclear ribonucleoprotein 1 [Cocos nucifera]|uniref:Heterogeneous nuclear ribonucleoprotein 1 n=1 Tax=Cocos nucifera TaxID=13894 RepID=A0A8K0IF30_COCNU|nr:heterogeneous nuclear ribonucleoprotein 1 [Cocos nucifera]